MHSDSHRKWRCFSPGRVVVWGALLTAACCALLATAGGGPAANVAAAQQSSGGGGSPEWIWLSAKPKDGETVYLRKVFTLPAEVQEAVLQVACDNHVTVFLNGEQLLQHEQWEAVARENVTPRLKPGDNVLACRCRNAGGPAALLLRLVAKTKDGRTITVVSDRTWRAVAEPQGNFRALKYDDAGWSAAHSFGPLGVAPWGQVSLDAQRAALATLPEAIRTLPGFRVELLYSVPKEQEGSWVSMTPDPKGRLICSDQYGGLYRVTPGSDAESTHVEKLDVPIGEAQGLLYAYDSLYVVVNGRAAQGSGVYRVRDTDGDDQFDEVKLLMKLQGGGEHGPHAVRLGPDGRLYVIAGNHTKIPDPITPDSPHRNWDEDHLLPRNPDGGGHANGILAPGGWIAHTDPQGSQWVLLCGGFRNPYDIAFNTDGELFTYDADMEWDTGTPWYRPTRVNHCVSAAEYGWRYGTGKWPAYYPDSVGAVVDIGLGSPTGIEFGTGARFPERYQRALFILDWTYGKIYAVHLQPQGASYLGTFEVFIEGRPLPVTDVCINPADGAMYFTIGGRRTQSGLYRVTYVGSESTAPAPPQDDPAAAAARQLRRQLEAFHGKRDPRAVDFAWPHLNSSDRAIRYAARIAIEHQDPSLWYERALSERRINASIQALLALARTRNAELQPRVVARLNELPLGRLTEEQMLDVLRVYGLAFIRLGPPSPEQVREVTARLDPLFPAESEWVNRELVQLLVYLEAPGIAARAMQRLRQAQTQQDQMHYAFVLRNLRHGWTPEDRLAYFSWLNLAEEKYKGGNSFKKFLIRIRQDAVEKLSDAERTALHDVIQGQRSVEVVRLETTRQFVHNWQMSDLEPLLPQVEYGRSFENGRQAYEAAQCAKCHRFQGEGGATGPDITGVGNRFDPRYLLESLIVPSKVVSDQYQNHIITTVDGEIIVGRILEEDEQQIRVRTHPFATDLTVIPKSQIDEMQPARISEMPEGLCNVLTKEEILDLIAYMRSAGNPQDRAFQPK
jgi:putative heme-binding domain-containing protein